MAILDGTISGIFAKMKAEKLGNINKKQLRAELTNQLQDYKEMVRKGSLDKEDYNVLKKNIQQKARVLGLKHLNVSM